MKNIPWYKKPEMVVALSALIMSLVTTVVAIYSANVDRAYARASVWPRLELFKSSSSTDFKYGITNSGTGPAIIKYAKVTYKSKPIKQWNEIPNIPNFTQSHISSKVLSPEHTLIPLKSKNTSVNKFLEINQHLKMELCYCSIYDECWLVDRSSNPTPIDQCSIDKELKFNQ